MTVQQRRRIAASDNAYDNFENGLSTEESLRSACRVYSQMDPEMFPAMTLTLPHRAEDLLRTLHVIELVAEEFDLQDKTHLSEQYVTIRFSRITE